MKIEVNVKVLKAKGLPNWRSMKECFYAAHNFTAKFILDFFFLIFIIKKWGKKIFLKKKTSPSVKLNFARGDDFGFLV